LSGFVTENLSVLSAQTVGAGVGAAAEGRTRIIPKYDVSTRNTNFILYVCFKEKGLRCALFDFL
jgi:hypothetical protein